MRAKRPMTVASEWRAHWPIVLTGTAGMTLASAAGFALGAVMPSLEKEFGWTRAQISTGPMVSSIMGIILSAGAGFAIDHLGARKAGITIVVAMTMSIMLMATLTANIWHWWLLWAFFGLAASATPTVWLTPVSGLFSTSRGLAIATILAGTGIAGVISPLIAEHFAESHEWRSGYLLIGLSLGLLTIPLVLRFWHGAEELDPEDTEAQLHSELPGMTAREALGTLNFYLIFAAYVSEATAVAAMIMNLVPMLVSTGLSGSDAASIAGVYGIASISGRFFGGWAIDQWGAKRILIASTLGVCALPVGLLTAPGAIAPLILAVAISAFMSGMKFPAIPYLVTHCFGPRSFGTLFGTLSISTAIGVAVGPFLASVIYDRAHSYSLVFWTVVPMLALSTVLYALLRRPVQFAIAR